MATPITWRNLNSRQPNVTGLMYGAQRGADQAFQSFNNVLNRENQTREANRENTIGNNTEEFRNQLAQQYQSSDELQAAQKSGAIAAMAEPYGGLIDKSVIRTAPEKRLNKLQERETAELARERGDRRFEEELKGYDRADTKYDRQENERAARRTAAALREGVLEGTDSAAAGRAAYAQKLEEANIPETMRTGLLSEFENEFEARYGLTAAQSQEVDSITEGVQTQSQAEIERAERDLTEAKRRYPVNDVFSFTDPEKVTVADGLKYLQSDLKIDDHGLSDEYTSKVDLFMENQGIDPEDPASARIPIGAIARQAAEQTGYAHNWDGLNRDLDEDVFYDNLKRVYRDYRASQENSSKLQGYIEDYDRRVNQAQEAITSTRSQAMSERRAKNLRLLQQNRNQ